jgi:hypothetical protein
MSAPARVPANGKEWNKPVVVEMSRSEFEAEFGSLPENGKGRHQRPKEEKGRRRGSSHIAMERPPDIMEPMVSAGSPEGARPASGSIASRGHRPPEDAAGPGDSHVAMRNTPVNCPYDDDGGQIVWHREVRTKDGVEDISIELANFKARIISDITRDDGVETARHYEVGATLGDRPFRFEVPSAPARRTWPRLRRDGAQSISPSAGDGSAPTWHGSPAASASAGLPQTAASSSSPMSATR